VGYAAIVLILSKTHTQIFVSSSEKVTEGNSISELYSPLLKGKNSSNLNNLNI
jgi:hypothetical protein